MNRVARLALAVTLPLVLLAGCATSNQAGSTASTTTGATDTASSAAVGGTVMKPTTKSGPLKLAYLPVVMNTSYEMVLAGIKEEIDKNGGDSFATLTVQVAIGGYDNTKDGRESILAGELTVTVDTGSKQMGAKVLQAVKEFVVEGKAVPRSIPVETKVYDATNMSEFDPNNYIYVPKK